MRTFVVAEIGVNHDGNLELAFRLVEAAARAGADAAKFQTFNADALAARDAAVVAYQKAAGAEDQHSMLRRLELGEAEHRALAKHCAELGLEFMSTAFDSRSLDMLCDIGIKRIKVPSGEVTNTSYLRDCARRGLPVLLSTGMADLAEVRSAVEVLRSTMPLIMQSDDDVPPLVVLHCTSAYPAELADANLRAMQTMAREFDVPVGYSDHTLGTFVPPIAVAMGATAIEKHLTLDRTMRGPDHAASIEPHEFEAMVQAIRRVELLLGDGVKKPRPAEQEARALVRRGLKAARDITAGTLLTEADLVALRPATGLAPEFLPTLLGRRLNRPLAAGDPIERSALE